MLGAGETIPGIACDTLVLTLGRVGAELAQVRTVLEELATELGT
jgi:hypothetical protein